MLDLTSGQVADAETAGVSFPAATPQQVQRFSMHLKAFRVGGEPVLATRDGALFETAATLARLILEGGVPVADEPKVRLGTDREQAGFVGQK